MSRESRIELRKSGLFHVEETWSPDKQEYFVSRCEQVTSICQHLGYAFVVEEGATFGDLLSHVEKEVDILSLIFSANMGNYPLSLYIEESKIPVDPQNNSGNSITELVVSKFCEIVNFAKFDYDDACSDFTVFTDFGGKGKDESGEEVNWSVSTTPVNELINIPLIIKEDISATLTHTGEDVSSWNKNLLKLPADANITLYEALLGIFHEISFYGGPKEREKFKQKLESDVAEAKEQMKETIEQIKNGTYVEEL
jgi:hypothetical protein